MPNVTTNLLPTITLHMIMPTVSLHLIPTITLQMIMPTITLHMIMPTVTPQMMMPTITPLKWWCPPLPLTGSNPSPAKFHISPLSNWHWEKGDWKQVSSIFPTNCKIWATSECPYKGGNDNTWTGSVRTVQHWAIYIPLHSLNRSENFQIYKQSRNHVSLRKMDHSEYLQFLHLQIFQNHSKAAPVLDIALSRAYTHVHVGDILS